MPGSASSSLCAAPTSAFKISTDLKRASTPFSVTGISSLRYASRRNSNI